MMISMDFGPEHVPVRPDWQCAECGADWPCISAKSALAEEYASDRVALLFYLALRQWEAIDDTRSSPGGIKVIKEMRQRFVSWTDELNWNAIPAAE